MKGLSDLKEINNVLASVAEEFKEQRFSDLGIEEPKLTVMNYDFYERDLMEVIENVVDETCALLWNKINCGNQRISDNIDAPNEDYAFEYLDSGRRQDMKGNKKVRGYILGWGPVSGGYGGGGKICIRGQHFKKIVEFFRPEVHVKSQYFQSKYDENYAYIPVFFWSDDGKKLNRRYHLSKFCNFEKGNKDWMKDMADLIVSEIEEFSKGLALVSVRD